MGKNISVYLDDDTLEWLDQLCTQWKLTRGRAIQTVLQSGRLMSEVLLGFIQTGDSTLARNLSKLLKKTEEKVKQK